MPAPETRRARADGTAAAASKDTAANWWYWTAVPPDRLVLLGNLQTVRAVRAGGDAAASEEAGGADLPHAVRC